jgi:predicted ribosome quality control (RQC) complex YloA/Tae2 family protein
MTKNARRLALTLCLVGLADLALSNPPRSRRGDAYVLARGDSCRMSGSLEELADLRERNGKAFLWARREGSSYLVKDERLRAEAEGLFAAVDALQPDYRALELRERKLDREDEALDDEGELIEAEQEARGEQDSATDDSDLDGRRDRLAEKRHDLHIRQRRLSDEERSLDRKEEALDAAAEAELWKLIDRAIKGGAAKPVSN